MILTSFDVMFCLSFAEARLVGYIAGFLLLLVRYDEVSVVQYIRLLLGRVSSIGCADSLLAVEGYLSPVMQRVILLI